jgi:hypothetical protein
MQTDAIIAELTKIKSYYFDKKDFVSSQQISAAIDVVEDYKTEVASNTIKNERHSNADTINTNKPDAISFKYTLHHKHTGETQVYEKATYTKINGTYGWLCVDEMKVKFFWADNQSVHCDELSDIFTVKIELTTPNG